MSTEKMSISKPMLKRPRPTIALSEPATLEVAPVGESDHLVGKDPRTTMTRSCSTIPASPLPPSAAAAQPSQTSSEEAKNPETMTHPKGHKVRELSEVWNKMDSQAFLHLTDTLTLGDVWVQPISATPDRGPFANVTFRQMVDAPHLKARTATCKMSNDDLLKVLYLGDTIQWMMQGIDILPFEDWLKNKSAACVQKKGMEEGSNRTKLCNFMLTEDHDYTLYPQFLKGYFGIFFRKICYHSYKTKGASGDKLINPSMMKCSATKGKFEYVLEARIFPLPANWYAASASVEDVEEEVPETQPM